MEIIDKNCQRIFMAGVKNKEQEPVTRLMLDLSKSTSRFSTCRQRHAAEKKTEEQLRIRTNRPNTREHASSLF